ncbi:hypothetical protein Moror_4886, partial [Moniliophthora roreri MCA 2997]
LPPYIPNTSLKKQKAQWEILVWVLRTFAVAASVAKTILVLKAIRSAIPSQTLANDLLTKNS